MITGHRPAAAIALACCLFASNAAADSQYQNLLTLILQGNQTVIGQTIAYPAGAPPVVTAAIVNIAPGRETGWHLHEVPLFVYVLEGEVTVDYGDKGIKVFKKGDGVLEAVNWPHNGMNKGSVPVRLMAIYMGVQGKANATLVPANK